MVHDKFGHRRRRGCRPRRWDDFFFITHPIRPLGCHPIRPGASDRVDQLVGSGGCRGTIRRIGVVGSVVLAKGTESKLQLVSGVLDGARPALLDRLCGNMSPNCRRRILPLRMDVRFSGILLRLCLHGQRLAECRHGAAGAYHASAFASKTTVQAPDEETGGRLLPGCVRLLGGIGQLEFVPYVLPSAFAGQWPGMSADRFQHPIHSLLLARLFLAVDRIANSVCNLRLDRCEAKKAPAEIGPNQVGCDILCPNNIRLFAHVAPDSYCHLHHWGLVGLVLVPRRRLVALATCCIDWGFAVERRY